MRILKLDKFNKRTCEKFVIALLIERLYSEHNILSFFGSNTSIKLIVSLPLIAGSEEISHLDKALNSVFLDTSGFKRLALRQGFLALLSKLS